MTRARHPHERIRWIVLALAMLPGGPLWAAEPPAPMPAPPAERPATAPPLPEPPSVAPRLPEPPSVAPRLPEPAASSPPLLERPASAPPLPEPPSVGPPPRLPMQPLPPGISIKALTELGVQLYERGDYDGAIRAFTQGYALRPKPVFLFNIAQAYRKSGQDLNALAFYEKFQLIDPRSPYQAETKAYIAYLRTRLGFDAPAPKVVRDAPLYKKGWFWGTLIPIVTVATVGITLGIVLGSDGPRTTLGTIEPKLH